MNLISKEKILKMYFHLLKLFYYYYLEIYKMSILLKINILKM